MSCLTSGIQIRKRWLDSPGASVSLSVKQMKESLALSDLPRWVIPARLCCALGAPRDLVPWCLYNSLRSLRKHCKSLFYRSQRQRWVTAVTRIIPSPWRAWFYPQSYLALKASSPPRWSWLDLQCYLNLLCHVPTSLQSLLFWTKYGLTQPAVNNSSSVKFLSASFLTQVGRVEAQSHTSINQGWVSPCNSEMVCAEGSWALQWKSFEVCSEKTCHHSRRASPPHGQVFVACTE